MSLTPGTRLGPYEVTALLGAGGMGEVYRGRDARLHRPVAIKVLPEHLASDPEALTRFAREARAVAALAHPNILVLHDIGSENGVDFLVTELLEGETLRDRLVRGPIPWRRVAQIEAAIAHGLAAAHSKGIVHRDITPGNIYLTADGHIKILDFGLADAAASNSADETETQTRVGPTVAGTLGYMSPEQVRGEEARPTSDIFSLGAVLYEAATGRRAFSGSTPSDTLAAVLKSDPPPAIESGAAISPELARIIDRCLTKNPSERFHAAEDLAFALHSLSDSVGDASPAARLASIRRSRTATVLAVVVLAIAGAWIYFSRRAPGRIESLAVLPFVNAGGDDAAWLSDGLTRSLIANLVQVPNLKVMSRNAVLRYEGKETDPKEAARDLNVRAVVSGRVLEHGGRLSVSAELVDARDDSVLWGEEFERSMSEILTVQQDITTRISEQLRGKISGEDARKLASQGTGNPEAYQLFLKGRYFAHKFTKDGFDKGLDYLRQAVEVDPSYARAYEGMSYAYQIAADSLLPPRDVCPKSIEAAEKAIALDDSLSEAHSDLAAMDFMFTYDWPAATRELDRALQLNPNSAYAHELHGWLLTVTGQPEQGIAEGRKSLEIDPLSVEAALVLAEDLYMLRRYEDARSVISKAIDQEPDYQLSYLTLGMIDLAERKPGDAVAALEKGRQLWPNDWITETLAAAYASSGNTNEARRILDELDIRAKKGGYVASYNLSYAYLALGDRGRALTALERDYEQRSSNMTFVKLDPGLDPLRGEPRYEAVARRMRLP